MIACFYSQTPLLTLTRKTISKTQPFILIPKPVEKFIFAAMQKPSKLKELSLLSSSFIPSFALLRKNDPLRLAGATAFFTTFSLPFIVFILAQLFSLFVSPKTMGQGLINNIANDLGQEGAAQVKQVIHSILSFNKSWYVIVFGFLFLLFVVTTLFMVIKNSLNQIWQVDFSKTTGITANLFSRLKSFAVIVLIGLLFFVNLFFKNIEITSGNYFENHFRGIMYFRIIFGEVISIATVAAWFILLFRFLADAQPNWKASVIGGLLTSILFTIGRYLLKGLLIDSNIGHLYGPSGSFVLVLLFVFYISFIMYYGASFVAIYSEKKHWPLKKQYSNVADRNGEMKKRK